MGGYKIIIVDNLSPDDSMEQLRRCLDNEKYKDVEVIQSDYNGGFSYGNNYGYRFCQKKYNPQYVIFSNSDVSFKKGAIRRLIMDLQENEKAVLVGPLVRNPDGEVTSLPMEAERTMRDLFDTKGWKKRVMPIDKVGNMKEVYLVNGCCFAVNAELFCKIDLFDENVFLYEEEYILAKKAQKNNLLILFEPKAEVIHYQGVSTGRQNIFIDQEFLKSTM